MAACSILIDHTTTSATLAEELAAHSAERGIRFLDAPVSGGQAGAVQGRLTIMVGGDPQDLMAAEPVMAAYGQRITHVGGHGAGQRCKMVNQICIAGILQGISEGLTLAKASGLDIATVAKVLGGGAAQSWQLDNRALTMAAGEFNFGFAIEWMHKDLGFCLVEAERLGLDLPMSRDVDARYQALIARGLGIHLELHTQSIARCVVALGIDADPTTVHARAILPDDHIIAVIGHCHRVRTVKRRLATGGGGVDFFGQ